MNENGGKFDRILPRQGLSTMKWEYEIARTGDPKLLSFGTADMDFKSPEPLLQAIRETVDRGHLGYPMAPESFYRSIEGYLKELCGWKINARACVGTNVGIYTSVWNVLDVLTQPGDEVVIQTPVHFCFAQILRDSGRVPVENPLKNVGGRYEMDFDQLERCFTPKTKIFWLCNPHNPVGRVWQRSELVRLAEICLRHGVWILSDDVYCGLTFAGVQYTPIASLSPEISRRTITCYSISKSYNTTGIKFSYVVTENPELLRGYCQSLRKLDLDYGGSLFGFAAAEAAYRSCGGWLRELMGYVQENLELLRDTLRERLPDVRVAQSEGTYFAWIDLRALKLSSDVLTDCLEKKGHLLLGSGSCLGTGGEGFVRMNLACPRSVLRQGMERLCAVLEKLERERRA